MLVDINATTVTLPDGTSVVCKQADVSVAISDSVAMRVVPVGPTGTPYPDAAGAVLIPADDRARDPQMRAFLNAVNTAAKQLIRDKGR